MFLKVMLAFGLLAAVPDRKAAQNFTLPELHGSSVRLSDYRGKVVLLDFWATTCGGCRIEIPWFVEFSERYKGKGLVTLGVALDDDGWKAIWPFAAQQKMNYPVLLGNEDVINRYAIEAMPKTLLIDRQGKIASTHVGLVDKASFEKEIRAVLSE